MLGASKTRLDDVTAQGLGWGVTVLDEQVESAAAQRTWHRVQAAAKAATAKETVLQNMDSQATTEESEDLSDLFFTPSSHPT